MTKGHVTDTCGVLLMTKADKIDPSLGALCATVILETLQIWKEEAKKRMACDGGNCPAPVFVPYAVMTAPPFDPTGGNMPFSNTDKKKIK